jgi:hypothetical protein
MTYFIGITFLLAAFIEVAYVKELMKPIKILQAKIHYFVIIKLENIKSIQNSKLQKITFYHFLFKNYKIVYKHLFLQSKTLHAFR